MKTLEEKGKLILDAVKNVREKHREMDEKLQQLVRIATYYSHGIDPQEIASSFVSSHGAPGQDVRLEVIITMKDGSVHRIPKTELDNG